MVLANATNFYRKSGKGSETILADRIQSEIAQGRILCVDDNLLELNAFSGRFWSCRATQLFRFVTPYRHCIAIVSTFDLAILDFDMPGMNGKISGVYLGQDTSVTIQHANTNPYRG